MSLATMSARMSVQAYTLGLIRPEADSNIASGDRAAVAWLFAGFDYTGAAPMAGLPRWRHIGVGISL